MGVAVARRNCIILIELGEWDRAERLLDQAMQWARTLAYSFMDGRLHMLRAELTAHKGKTAISDLDASVGEAVTVERRLGSRLERSNQPGRNLSIAIAVSRRRRARQLLTGRVQSSARYARRGIGRRGTPHAGLGADAK
jgi:hypothetical protein